MQATVPLKRAKRLVSRRLRPLAKRANAIPRASKAVFRRARFYLIRSETPVAAWFDGQANWALARLRCSLTNRSPAGISPIVKDLHRYGYAKAEGLLDPEIVSQVYRAFLIKMSNEDRVKHITNPDSSHPEFAGKVSIHPGVVVGQLQYRKAISYSHSREMLSPVRDLVTEVARTDGWE